MKKGELLSNTSFNSEKSTNLETVLEAELV